MVKAYHVIFCAYGFWLPNDPRGSWSDFIGAWELLRFGKATKTQTRQSVAGNPHDKKMRKAAKHKLRFPPVHFTGAQARSIGSRFADFAQISVLNVLACTILPEHVHMIITRHRYKIEYAINLLNGAASRELVSDKLHPFAAHSREGERLPNMWARGQWKVFLNSQENIAQAVQYIEDNPLKEGKSRQKWGFVRVSAGQSAPLSGRG